MSELTLLVLRLGFLALLWLFVFIVLYSVRSDLFGPPIPKVVRAAVDEQDAAAADPLTEPVPVASAAPSELRRLVITAGPRSGTEIELPAGGLVIGRSSKADLQVSDDFTSSKHARVSRSGGEWVLEDLGSTNGTFLGGKRVTDPVVIPAETTVRVGTTQFELKS